MDDLIEKMSDSKVIILVVAVLGFLLYNRSKQQEMQMLLKMKELEMQAAVNQRGRGEQEETAAGPSGESKKKK